LLLELSQLSRASSPFLCVLEKWRSTGGNVLGCSWCFSAYWSRRIYSCSGGLRRPHLIGHTLIGCGLPLTSSFWMEEAGVQRWGDTLSTRLFPSHSFPGPFRLDTAPVVFRSSWNTPQACILAPNGLAFPQLTRRRWHKSGTLLVCFPDVPATIQIFAAPIFYYYS
jgi:hypothetical protein